MAEPGCSSEGAGDAHAHATPGIAPALRTRPGAVLPSWSLRPRLSRGDGAHLPQGALHAAQEVVVLTAEAAGPVAVVDLEPQLLRLLKVVVKREDLGEHGVQAAPDHLRPVHLQQRGAGRGASTRPHPGPSPGPGPQTPSPGGLAPRPRPGETPAQPVPTRQDPAHQDPGHLPP